MSANRLSFDDRSPAFADFELRLQSSLQPVNPDPKFVYTLREKLVTHDNVELERQSGALSLLIIAGGLFTGVILLMISRRLYNTIFK
jgi:hypothetical protein